MKRLRHTEDTVTFRINEGERELLHFVLNSYPMSADVWPATEANPDKGPTGPDPALLKSAMEETKQAHRRRVAEFLGSQPPLAPKKKHVELWVKREDMDWLLQVANEVRVGAWYALGCPEEEASELAARPDVDYDNLLRMEFALLLQCVLLDEQGSS